MRISFSALFISGFFTLITSFSAHSQVHDPEVEQKGFTNLQNAGKLISMVVEPADNQLKVFLSGTKAADVKLDDATVEASYTINGKTTKLRVTRKKDAGTNRSYYLIDEVTPETKNLKIDIKAGKHNESFLIQDLQ